MHAIYLGFLAQAVAYFMINWVFTAQRIIPITLNVHYSAYDTLRTDCAAITVSFVVDGCEIM